MAKYNKEIKIWFKQEENRKQSGLVSIECYKKQIKLLENVIGLEKEQIKCIDEGINNTKKEWNYGK